jgi:hypothetical protein
MQINMSLFSHFQQKSIPCDIIFYNLLFPDIPHPHLHIFFPFFHLNFPHQVPFLFPLLHVPHHLLQNLQLFPYFMIPLQN